MTSRLVSTLIIVGTLGGGYQAFAQAPLWTRVSGSAEDDRGLAVAVDADKDVYLAGTGQGPFDGQGAIGSGMCLIKYSPSGKKLWTRFYGPTAAYPAAMAVDATNNVYVAGTLSGPFQGHTKIAGQTDMFLLKLDRNGNKLWMRTASSKERDFAEGLAIGGSKRNRYVG